ncbi:MAG: DUF2634 domain-containing protein [Clostridia bacterium]|nr:DUF2634 domain-containing protein [Clostridiales bacterium]MDU7433690.1 DUF2634 domain-containing protein [Anaerococcus vaginalis]MDU7504562.1 DUF2634 domain-containing protein [Clostridia bacterium]
MQKLPETMMNVPMDVIDLKPESKDLPYLREWAYDFETNQFKLDDHGQMYFVTGNEALKIWIYWAIMTERYKYLAYTHAYGCEILDLVGYPLSSEAKASEVRRMITEAVMVCPYVKRINRIDLEMENDALFINVNLTSIYDEGEVELYVAA